MKIVIDIDDNLYTRLFFFFFDDYDYAVDMATAIRKGTPLPEHHGRLIDADKVLDDIEKKYPASVSEIEKCKKYARLVYYWAVKNAPTIIEGSEKE